MSTLPAFISPSIEVITDDDRQTQEQLDETLLQISEITFKDCGHAHRSIHAKISWHQVAAGKSVSVPTIP